MSSRGEVRSLISQVRKMRDEVQRKRPARFRFNIDPGPPSPELQRRHWYVDADGVTHFTLRIGPLHDVGDPKQDGMSRPAPVSDEGGRLLPKE
jgi:hypothetical protein